MIISPAKAADAASVLGVSLEDLSADKLSTAYRSLAKEGHPDAQGDRELWARISWAKECLTHWLAKQPKPEDQAQSGVKCRICGGSGRVQAGRANRFGMVLTMQCTSCRGLGEVFPEEDDHD